MKEIKGFQQPDPKGKDMLRTEEGPWKIYQRGRGYRIGRKRWYGIQWFRKFEEGSYYKFKTNHLANAKITLKEINEQAYDKEWYKDSKWEVKK